MIYSRSLWLHTWRAQVAKAHLSRVLDEKSQARTTPWEFYWLPSPFFSCKKLTVYVPVLGVQDGGVSTISAISIVDNSFVQDCSVFSPLSDINTLQDCHYCVSQHCWNISQDCLSPTTCSAHRVSPFSCSDIQDCVSTSDIANQDCLLSYHVTSQDCRDCSGSILVPQSTDGGMGVC